MARPIQDNDPAPPPPPSKPIVLGGAIGQRYNELGGTKWGYPQRQQARQYWLFHVFLLWFGRVPLCTERSAANRCFNPVDCSNLQKSCFEFIVASKAEVGFHVRADLFPLLFAGRSPAHAVSQPG